MTNNKRIDLSSVFPIMSLEKDIVITWNGTVGVGFEVTSSAEQETLEAMSYISINQSIMAAMKSLPVGTVFQKMDIYFHKETDEVVAPEQVFKNKIKEHLTQKPLMYHKSYIFISFPRLKESKGRAKIKKTNPISNLFVNLARTARNATDKLMASKLDVLDGIDKRMSYVSLATTFLERIKMSIPGFSFRKLSEHDFDVIYKQYFNLRFDKEPDGFYASIANDISSISVGPNKLNIISLESMGSTAFDIVSNSYDVVCPQMYHLTHYMDIPHILMTNIMICDNEEELDKLDFNKTFLTGLNRNSEDNILKLESMDAFTQTVRAGNKKIVRLGVHVLVWDINDSQRNSYIDLATSGIRTIQDSTPLIETMDALALYFNLAPCNADQSNRYMLTTADVALTYTHFIGKAKSSSVEDGILLSDRQKNLIKVNLFDYSLNNQNAIIVGPSGAGKSFTTGYLIVQRHEMPKTKQIIIDIGGTYRDTVYALVGKDSYYEYSLENPMKFNPFYIEAKTIKYNIERTITENGIEKSVKIPVEAKQYVINEQKKNFLIALIGVLLLEDGANYEKEQKAILLELIALYYHQVNEDIKMIAEERAYAKVSNQQVSENEKSYPLPKLSAFYDFVIEYFETLKNTEESQSDYYRFKQALNIIVFQTVLKPFAHGDYKNIFDSDKMENLSDHKLIVFDLDRVKDNPTLYRIVAMLVIELAYDLCSFDQKEIVKYIYLDEAWKTISGIMGEWISEMFRTIRKRNGGISVITQSTAEIDETGLIGQAIKINADTRIILRHTDGMMISNLQRSLGFTDHEVSLIQSIRSDQEGREFFVKQGTKSMVFYLLTPIQINGLLSSKPVEKAIIQTLNNYYQNIDYALNQYKEFQELGLSSETIEEILKTKRNKLTA